MSECEIIPSQPKHEVEIKCPTCPTIMVKTSIAKLYESYETQIQDYPCATCTDAREAKLARVDANRKLFKGFWG